MFVRRKKNKSGSVSVQLISKSSGKYEVIKTIGSSFIEQEIDLLVENGRQEIEKIKEQPGLFVLENDILVENFLTSLENAQVRTIGPELVFGKVYDYIGFKKLKSELFRHLVIARLAFPLSKLKTIEYLERFQGIRLDLDAVYRFLDKLSGELKEEVEQISFEHTKKVLQGNLSIVFYDLTTLYFETSDGDDLRKTGFSKDGKHSNPQIYIGLLVGLGGYAIGYDIFEGSIYEGQTLIPLIEKMSRKFELSKPIIVADAGLLNAKNILSLEEKGYQYILGARIKNECKIIKDKILETSFKNAEHIVLEKGTSKLVVQYSEKRARKDENNRERGLKRLEKQIKSGKLSKQNLNNRGYNKYLKMEGDIRLEIDLDKFEADKKWDGLKGYVTNCDLPANEIMDNYRNLWQIEKAFRMSKTDLRIRPIYHRLRRRIEAHICLSFTAYAVYKELERVLKEEKFELSVEKAAEITHNMYQLEITLPQSRHSKKILLKMDANQTKLIHIIDKNF
jgi:transposase